MFSPKLVNSSENNFHKRALTVFYDDHNSTYSQFLMAKSKPTNDQDNIKVFKKHCTKNKVMD